MTFELTLSARFLTFCPEDTGQSCEWTPFENNNLLEAKQLDHHENLPCFHFFGIGRRSGLWMDHPSPCSRWKMLRGQSKVHWGFWSCWRPKEEHDLGPIHVGCRWPTPSRGISIRHDPFPNSPLWPPCTCLTQLYTAAQLPHQCCPEHTHRLLPQCRQHGPLSWRGHPHWPWGEDPILQRCHVASGDRHGRSRHRDTWVQDSTEPVLLWQDCKPVGSDPSNETDGFPWVWQRNEQDNDQWIWPVPGAHEASSDVFKSRVWVHCTTGGKSFVAGYSLYLPTFRFLGFSWEFTLCWTGQVLECVFLLNALLER